MQLPRLPISPEAAFIVTCSVVGVPLYSYWSAQQQRKRLEEARLREDAERKRRRAEQEERRRSRH
jgi:hypothetical protein